MCLLVDANTEGAAQLAAEEQCVRALIKAIADDADAVKVQPRTAAERDRLSLGLLPTDWGALSTGSAPTQTRRGVAGTGGLGRRRARLRESARADHDCFDRRRAARSLRRDEERGRGRAGLVPPPLPCRAHRIACHQRRSGPPVACAKQSTSQQNLTFDAARTRSSAPRVREWREARRGIVSLLVRTALQKRRRGR